MLEFQSMSAKYGAITALRDVSISVTEGELVGLIGPNGAGKTTVLSCIAGVVKPTEGEILFQGSSVLGKTPEEIAHLGIAMVPENRGIFSTLTVEENLRMGAYVRRDRAEYRQDLDEMCRRFPILGERINQQAGTLSGGEQQQLAIARALMSHPKLLMLDEPSLGLAPIIVDQVFELIDGLHQRGATILLVEQNVDRALQVADRAYLLSTGSVQMQGPAADLRQRVDIEDIYLGDTKRS